VFKYDNCRGSVSRLAVKSLVNETGILKWVASLGVGNNALTLSMKRLTKYDEYPGGRFLMAETQAEWDNISKFHSNDPKTHSLYGKYFVVGFLFVKLTHWRYFNSIHYNKTVSPLMVWSQIIYGHRTASSSQKIVQFYGSRTAPCRRQEESYDFLSIF